MCTRAHISVYHQVSVFQVKLDELGVDIYIYTYKYCFEIYCTLYLDMCFFLGLSGFKVFSFRPSTLHTKSNVNAVCKGQSCSIFLVVCTPKNLCVFVLNLEIQMLGSF